MAVKSIETEYNGCRFRSRLEARWAVFFDEAKISYEYEPEGFKLPNGERYLPDFYLPELDTHVEVKGRRKGYEQEIVRLPDFIVWGGPIKQIVILSDVPGLTNDNGLWHFPAFYYSVRCDGTNAGWFYFLDCNSGCRGVLSGARYPRPLIFRIDLELSRPFSIRAVSDKVLKRNSCQVLEDELKHDATFATHKTYYETSDDGCKFGTNHMINERVFDALLKARQARFEFGETPKHEKKEQC